MNIKSLVTNAIVATLYIIVSFAIQPIAFTGIQFRLSEIFNHLVVFNKKFFYGIVIGVLITNLFSPLGSLDLIFGLGQSIISLLIIIGIGKFIKNKLLLMGLNTLIFTFNMFIIAYELKLAFDLPFFLTWGTTAIGEFTVMAIGIPLMKILNDRLKFKNLI